MRFKGTILSMEERWAVFEDAYTDCLRVAAEYARYEWHWQQRTQWLAEHSAEKDTPPWQERRDKRTQMTERWNELRTQFVELARVTQACAMSLGMEARPRLQDEYQLDFERTGDGLDVLKRQWAQHLVFHPEAVPF